MLTKRDVYAAGYEAGRLAQSAKSPTGRSEASDKDAL